MAVFAALALAGAVLSTGVAVNNNLIDYLPESAPSTRALDIMKETFGESLDSAQAMTVGVNLQEALDMKRRLADIPGVTSVTWLDDYIDISVPLEMANQSIVGAYYRDGNALFTITIAEGGEVEAVNAIRAILGPDDALAGVSADRAKIRNITAQETRSAMLILLPLILIVLIVSTESWLEPLLYLGAIGVSALINMGANIFAEDISFITQTVSPILQLAVSLDYAVFLLHRFNANRLNHPDMDPLEAMREAMTFSFSAIAASAATTFFGFLALMFMKFQIGADLGLNLVKGIALSFAAVIVFLPALTLCVLPMLDKTKHRPLLPNFAKEKVRNGRRTYGVGSSLYKARWGALAIAALMIVPVYLAQDHNSFIYGMAVVAADDGDMSDAARIGRTFGSSSPLALLVSTGEPGREAELSARLGKLPGVSNVISYATQVGSAIPSAMVPPDSLAMLQSGGWSRLIIYTDAKDESPEAYQLVADIRAVADELYPSASYLTGSHANLYDIRDVVTQDNTVVNLAAIGAIVFVLLLTFRSISLPVLLTLTIETATWINLSVPYFTNSPLCYVGYLIVSTVQLGATVDYAILFTDHYIKNRRRLGKRAAIARSTSKTFGSILISGVILSGAGIALALTSSNAIVSQMGVLLARGTALSFLMVMLFLPAACSLLDGVIHRTTIGARFLRKGQPDNIEPITCESEGSDAE